ncbi:MAG: DUF819 family protein [Woeseiaceae bacterium]|nr:DUF819 family protein [Woeseiaceae bacterium]
MSLPIISADQDFAIWAVLIALAAFGFWCERFPWGRKYSGVMLLITLAIVLANLRIIPTAAPAYDVVWDYLVPIAIPLLLFHADLKRILSESGPTLIAFIVGGASVVAGVLIGVSLFDLGPEEAKLAGIFTGTYIGGGLNFAAVAEATAMQDSNVLTAAVAADQVITNLHFLLIIVIPSIAWFARRFPTHHMDNAVAFDADSESVHKIANLDIAGLLTGLALAFALAAIGKLIANQAGIPDYSILVITLLALIVATGFPRQVKKLSGHREAGNMMMFIFLGSIAAGADVWLLIEIAPVLFLFACVIIAVHLAILFVVGKFLKLDLAELAMASAILIGGPASAPALASAKGWRGLLIPGLLLGSLGYAVGSFIGVSVFEWLS